jgi:hypothetical protein
MQPNASAANSAPTVPAERQSMTGRQRRRCRLPPGLVRAEHAAAWCSVSLRTWRSWDAAGLVPRRTAKIGNIVLWSMRELRDWRDAGCPDRRTWETMRAANLNGRDAQRHAGG